MKPKPVYALFLAAAVPAWLACTVPQDPCPGNTSVLAATKSKQAAGPLYVDGSDPYQPGPLPVRTVRITRCQTGAPAAMDVYVPDQHETFQYPVIMLLHGFLADTSYYSQLLNELASHGFVVVAPQLYLPAWIPIGQPSTYEEAALAAELIEWLRDHLNQSASVSADTNAIGLVGHSRGGRVAYLMLTEDPTCAQAVAGLDPVDSRFGTFMDEPQVTAQPFNFAVPSLIIAAGRGLDSVLPLGPPCAPPGRNHVQYYEASQSPVWHIFAPDAGHNDLLDDDLSNTPVGFVCVPGIDPPATRTLTVGLLVAFFRASLQGDPEAYDSLADTTHAPLHIEVKSK